MATVVAPTQARLFDALQDRLAEVIRLGEASEAIAALGDLSAVGAQLARQAAHLLGAERAAVLLLDPDGEELVVQPPACGFRPSQLRKLSFRVSVGEASARVLEGGRPLITNDAPADGRDLSRFAHELGDRSLLIVPLRAAAQRLGVLRVSNKRHGLFTQQDARLLAVFAAQAAVALENAMLYQEAVREREQLKELERLKSQFLSLVSHELRTPLASIKASAEVLLSTAPPGAAARTAGPAPHRRGGDRHRAPTSRRARPGHLGHSVPRAVPGRGRPPTCRTDRFESPDQRRQVRWLGRWHLDRGLTCF